MFRKLNSYLQLRQQDCVWGLRMEGSPDSLCTHAHTHVHTPVPGYIHIQSQQLTNLSVTDSGSHLNVLLYSGYMHGRPAFVVLHASGF